MYDLLYNTKEKMGRIDETRSEKCCKLLKPGNGYIGFTVLFLLPLHIFENFHNKVFV